MIDLEAKIVSTLAEKLRADLAAAFPGLADLKVVKGREVASAGDDRGELKFPTLVVIAGEAVEDEETSIWKEEDVDAETTRTIWRRGRVDFPIDLWLYTSSKTQRLEMMPTLRSVLYPFGDDGDPVDLILDLADYYDASARYRVLRSGARDEQSASEGYATYLFKMRVSTLLLDHRDTPKHTYTVQE